jgi:hypothetical protein
MHDLSSFIILALCVVLFGVVYARFVRASRGKLPEPHVTPASTHHDTTLPQDFHDWTYLRYSPDLRVAQEDLPIVESFPNIYVVPAGYADYLDSGVFPEGTIAFRRLDIRNLPRASAVAGRKCRICFAPDRAYTADVRIKDTARFPDTGGWGYFQFDLSQLDNPA